ncbi:GNAT family N-acetyltransferase [Rhizomonospora bruguierae]|uniref:GNAT family N-acetyltransferase n=1 Tax=Rhizomonospora bruguierae TaxID=1581705 RepID=UPI0020BD6C4E|nr:GNAT family protein [Micromonospora sp. NBRC 107566]
MNPARGSGWPVMLVEGDVLLRPYRRRDAAAWSEVRRVNRQWLAPWESTPPGSWTELNSPVAFRYVYRDARKAGRTGTGMPFAICLCEPAGERLVGHLNISNIVRRAFCSAYAGYWIDSRVAGRGIMPTALALAVDHAFTAGGLHRIEVNIRPENAPSRRVVEKLGFREEAYHPRYLHIDGAWRDHIGYGLTAEDVATDGGLLARWKRLRASSR